MRSISTHRVNPCNEDIRIEVHDQPGPGGACHRYVVKGPDKDFGGGIGIAPTWGTNINFQRGPIPESGVNGLTQEVLLAIVKDRLEGFQSGPFACDENAAALDHVSAAIDVLHSRTRDRMERGVEGTHKH